MKKNRLPKVIRCVCRTESMSWCGRPLTGDTWAFVDWSHAERAVHREDPQVPCFDCMSIASVNDPVALRKTFVVIQTDNSNSAASVTSSR